MKRITLHGKICKRGGGRYPPFPFSDLTSKVRRPALVVASLEGEDLILCQITSKYHLKDPYQISLSSKDFSKKGLKVSSFIKPSIIFTLRKSIPLYSAGKVSKGKMLEVENKICEIIKN